MQCKNEEYFEGSTMHFYNRTTSGKLLFLCHNDYIYFLEKFKINTIKYPCKVFAYCLMPTHFHFCLQQSSEQPMYRIFNDTMTSYAMHYNHKYKNRGQLMEDRLQSKRIKTDEYLIQLCKYIHYNPVKAGLVHEVEDWVYSNYLEVIRKRNGDLFSTELIEMYPEEFENYSNSIKQYLEYIEERGFSELLIDD